MVKGFEQFQKVKIRRLTLLKELILGNKSSGNYTEYDVYGVPRYKGNATLWVDMIADLFGKRLSSTAGKVDYDWDENAINFQSGGSISNIADRVQGNQEINHNFKVGTSITFKPHIHWFQGALTKYVLTAKYRLQRNGQVKTTDWITIIMTANDSSDIWTYSSGVLNQITRFPDITINCGISDTIQWQMARTDSLGGDMLVYFFDLHGEIDSLGSEEEISKNV